MSNILCATSSVLIFLAKHHLQIKAVNIGECTLHFEFYHLKSWKYPVTIMIFMLHTWRCCCKMMFMYIGREQVCNTMEETVSVHNIGKKQFNPEGHQIRSPSLLVCKLFNVRYSWFIIYHVLFAVQIVL